MINLLCHIRARRRWCWAVLLLIVEMTAFACLHAVPNDNYSTYVAQTVGQYSTLFGLIFWENLQSALWLILYGTVPFGLGTICGTYAITENLVSAAKGFLPQIGGRTLFLCILLLLLPAVLLAAAIEVIISARITEVLLKGG